VKQLVLALVAAPLLALAQQPQPAAPEGAPAAAAPAQPAPAPQVAPLPQPLAAPPPQVTAPPQVQVVQPAPPAPPAYPPPPQYAPAAPPAHPAPPPRPLRSSWYAAFAIGGGDGNVRGSPAGAGAKRTLSLHDYFGKGPITFAFDLEVGATLTPKLLLGGELTAFAAAAAYDGPYGTSTASLAMTNVNAVLTFYPFERGLFLRGGAGLASLGATQEVQGPAGKVKSKQTARGGDVALGAGYALWAGDRFNLSLNLDWSRQLLSGDGFTGASFWRLGVGFGWY
jgi:hypothetical protein